MENISEIKKLLELSEPGDLRPRKTYRPRLAAKKKLPALACVQEKLPVLAFVQENGLRPRKVTGPGLRPRK